MTRRSGSPRIGIPSDETWRLIEQWVPRAADMGQRFGLSEWLIAALTHEIGGLVWSRCHCQSSAGGRSQREEGELTVVLKNSRMAGEYSGRTDGSPRLEIKGTFSC